MSDSDLISDADMTRCGYIAILGRPNVGKSTLLNQLLGQKLSITSRKPQTTRHQILGIKTVENRQMIFVDTPGLHLKEKSALNRYMNKMARQALRDVDVIIFVVDSTKWTEEDTMVLNIITKATLKNSNDTPDTSDTSDTSKPSIPVILGVNKTDTISEKETLLPQLQILSEKFPFTDIIPISAKRGTQLEVLEKKVISLLPENPHFFPMEQVTDKTLRFRMAEIIREKLTRMLGEEIPYSITIEIETLKNEEKLVTIHAIVWVEREGQKPIVIGQKGERLKEIGIRSRVDMESILGKKVHLRLWVKVKSGWSDNERALASLGYLDL